MFITKKKIGGKEYYYLQKSIREGKKVKSKIVAYLGKDKKNAEKRADEIKNQYSEKNEKQFSQLEKKEISIEELAVFCKRRGFVYQSGEIYGSLTGFFDFGHLGVELVNNIKKEWWIYHVQNRNDIVGVDGSIITNPKVWEASGHVSNFVEIAVRCKNCGYKTKIDKHELERAKCDKCSSKYENRGEFNTMFTTQVGPIKEESVKAYLRPETAQLIFSNFKFVQENARLQLPFGVAQIGKAFRNEISPREFLFRAREFEQMEIEYFISPEMSCSYLDEIKGIKLFIYSEEMQKNNFPLELMDVYEAYKKGIIKNEWHAYWIAKEYEWFVSLGADSNNFRARQHLSEERSHYSKDTWDLEYKFPMGWRELQGFANRGDFDLSQHQKYSKKSMEITDEKGNKFLPHVVCEPSLGVGRAFLVFMIESHFYDKRRNNTVLKLNPRIAPIKAAVFPIIKKSEYEEIALSIVKELKKEFNVIYDKSGSIGRRYSRNDEIGTPFCITIDELSKKKEVTIRERDSTEQIRVKIDNLKNVLRKLINSEIEFKKAGKLIKTRVKLENESRTSD